jgi:hypothetical protein
MVEGEKGRWVQERVAGREGGAERLRRPRRRPARHPSADALGLRRTPPWSAPRPRTPGHSLAGRRRGERSGPAADGRTVGARTARPLPVRRRGVPRQATQRPLPLYRPPMVIGAQKGFSRTFGIAGHPDPLRTYRGVRPASRREDRGAVWGPPRTTSRGGTRGLEGHHAGGGGHGLLPDHGRHRTGPAHHPGPGRSPAASTPPPQLGRRPRLHEGAGASEYLSPGHPATVLTPLGKKVGSPVQKAGVSGGNGTSPPLPGP